MTSIPKPFRMMELISRIRALLRRTEDEGAEEYQIGNLYVCPARHIATVDKQNVNLTLKEYEVLCLLLKNSGTVLSRTPGFSIRYGAMSLTEKAGQSMYISEH